MNATATKQTNDQAAIAAQLRAMEQLNVASLPFVAKPGEKTSGNFQMWNVPLKSMILVPGLIPRIETLDCLEHIDALAGSMKNCGFYADKPLVGYVGKDSQQKSVIYIVQGGMRYKAAMLARKRGADLESAPVMVCEGAADAADMLVRMVTENAGRRLTPLESAVIGQRLARMGWDNATISKNLDIPQEKIAIGQEFMSADHRVRDLIASQVISMSVALEVIRTHGANAYDVLENAQRRAAEAGEARTANA